MPLNINMGVQFRKDMDAGSSAMEDRALQSAR